MADQKISQLSSASTPLAGTEVLPIVQSGTTKKVSIATLTEGRSVMALNGAAKAWDIPAFQITNAAIYAIATETGYYANAYYSGGWKYSTAAAASGYLQNGGIHQWYTAASGSANAAISFTQTMQLDASGSAYNVTGTWGTFSDIKIKENIAEATPKLNDVLKIRVVNYNRIGNDQKEIGVIAQELEQIFPALVEEIDGLVEGEKTKAVKYSIFVPILIKAVQELSARVAALESAK
jgi:hypothetical protein